MADERAQPTRTERDDLLERKQEELTRLREELAHAERDRDRWKRQSERLRQQLDAGRRAWFRPAAPFAKGRPQGRGGRRGRRPGASYGRRARRPIPSHVDVTSDAPLTAACPDCGGALHVVRVASQYQEDLPVVRPIVRWFGRSSGDSTWKLAAVSPVVDGSKAGIPCRPPTRWEPLMCTSDLEP